MRELQKKLKGYWLPQITIKNSRQPVKRKCLSVWLGQGHKQTNIDTQKHTHRIYLLLSWKTTPKRSWDEVNFPEFHSLTSRHEILSWKGAFAPPFKYLGHQWLRVWETSTQTSAANRLFCEPFVCEFGFSGRARTVVSIIILFITCTI